MHAQESRGIDGNPVIQFEQVSKAFGSLAAVHETDLTIAEGEFFSLLGPSGCGKTTTLRMIAGFERPTSGRIRLDGVEVSTVPPYRRNVNTVFQQYALFPHLSVFDNVAFGLRSSRTPAAEVRDRVEEMLAVVRLPDVSLRKPNQLSGGQQQRVALARALVNRPRALLLDEPLGALDLKLRESMQAELKRIQGELGSTFVYVTHDQGEALTMSDRIAVMHRGRTEQIGTPQDIYHRPASAFVASFIGNANLLRAQVVERAPAPQPGGARLVVEVSGLGRYPATATVDPLPAGPLLFMLRPEAIVITEDEPAQGVAVAVTITEVTFAGATLRCAGRSDGGATLDAAIVPTAVGARPQPGTRMWMSWQHEAARLVPADSAPAEDLPAGTGAAPTRVPLTTPTTPARPAGERN